MTDFPLLNAILFAGTGLILFAIAFAILSRTISVRLWSEIVDGKNTALAVLVGLIAVGMAIIIAATMH